MTLNPREITIFSLNLDAADSMFDYLNEAEKKQAEQLRIERVRNRFIASRGYLRHLLSQYLNMPAAKIVILKESFGKPFVENYPLYFNIAHSHELAVFAFSLKSPIGIDIEKHRSNIEIMDIAKRVMTDHELSFLKNATDKETLFFDIWARKEAIIKATGEGFHAILTTIETLDPNGDYLNKVLDNQKNEWFLEGLQLQGFSGAIASRSRSSINFITSA